MAFVENVNDIAECWKTTWSGKKIGLIGKISIGV